MRAALEWSFATKDKIAPRLALALGRFWLARWQLAEGRAWLERGLGRHQIEDGMRAALLGLLGGVLHDTGDLTEAERLLADGLRIADAAGAPVLAARIRVRHADVRLALGAISERDALAECEAAATTLETAQDTAGLADALAVVGKLRFWLRDGFHETLERAAALGRESGNRPAELLAAEWLAVSLHDLSLPVDMAIQRQEQLLAEVAGEPRAEAAILATLAWNYGFAGRFDEARDALARSGQIYSADFGWTLEWAACAMNAGAIELMAGDAAAAERVLRPAYDELREMGEANYLMDTGYYLASSLCEQGRSDEAQQVVEAMRSALPSGSEGAEAMCQLAAAKVKADRGESLAAERLAQEGRRRIGTVSPRWLGQALLTQAEVLELAGKPEKAAAVFREALALYEDRRAAPLAERARLGLRRVADRITPAD